MSATLTFSGTAVDAVRDFSALTRRDVDYAGGKGANLGDLTLAGLPVPSGFVIGAPAYRAFCDVQGLRARIEDQLRDLDVDDTLALTEVSGRVRDMVAREPLPDWLEETIRDAYAR